MVRLMIALVVAAGLTGSAQAQDPHLSETGTAVVLSHSVFAHGYRHGYEEGYHVGNADASLGTAARAPRKVIAMATAAASRWAMPTVFCCVLRVAGWKPASKPE